MSPASPTGRVVWIEGLPGSGKSTLAQGLRAALEHQGRRVLVIDGEQSRREEDKDLGFSRKDREVHAQRVSARAKEAARDGTTVIVAMITPYETGRSRARATVGDGFLEVWLRCPIEVCQKRNPSGLFSRSASGELTRLTGVDDPWEIPLAPDLVLRTDQVGASECVARVLAVLPVRSTPLAR